MFWRTEAYEKMFSKMTDFLLFRFCVFRAFSKKHAPKRARTGTRVALSVQIPKELAYCAFCTTANPPPTNVWHRKVLREPTCIFKTFARQCAKLSAPSIILVRGRAAHVTCREQNERGDWRPSGSLLAAYATLAFKGRPFF